MPGYDAAAGRTTYGDLLALSIAALGDAHTELRDDPPRDEAALRHAVDEWRELLDTARRHLTAVLGGEERVAGLRVNRSPDLRDHAATLVLEAFAGLPPVAGSPQQQPVERSGWHVAERLGEARRALGAAHDLLETHRGTNGVPRTQALIDMGEVSVRAYPMLQVARAIIDTVDLAQPLREAATMIGLPDEHGLIPDVTDLGGRSRDLHALSSGLDPDPRLALVTVARPPVRDHDPVLEIGDRMQRLAFYTFALPQEQFVGAATLHYLITANVALHLRLVSMLERFSDNPVAALRLSEVSQAQAPWVTAAMVTSRLTSPTPGHRGVRADVTAIRQALDTVSRAGRPEDAAALLGVVGVGADMAPRIGEALRTMHALGQVHTHGRYLERGDTIDSPKYARAKLRNELVTAPTPMIHRVTDALHDAASATPRHRSSSDHRHVAVNRSYGVERA